MKLWIIESRDLRESRKWEPDFGFPPELKQQNAEAVAANCNDVKSYLQYRAVPYKRIEKREKAEPKP